MTPRRRHPSFRERGHVVRVFEHALKGAGSSTARHAESHGKIGTKSLCGTTLHEPA